MSEHNCQKDSNLFVFLSGKTKFSNDDLEFIGIKRLLNTDTGQFAYLVLDSQHVFDDLNDAITEIKLRESESILKEIKNEKNNIEKLFKASNAFYNKIRAVINKKVEINSC